LCFWSTLFFSDLNFSRLTVSGISITVVFNLALHERNARVRLLDASDLTREDVGDLDLIGHIIWFLVVVVFDSDVTDRKDSRRLCVFGQHYFLVT
jgi:hypothetical protein